MTEEFMKVFHINIYWLFQQLALDYNSESFNQKLASTHYRETC